MNKEHLHPDGRPYTKEEFVEKIKTDKSFAKRFANLGPVYGKQWRNWGGELVTKRIKEEGKFPVSQNVMEGQIDQIANAIHKLKTNPDDRGIIVSAWNVGELDDMVLRPCHYGFQVYTRELSAKERIELAGGKIQEKYPALIEQSLRVCDEREIPTRAISLMWNQRSVDTFLGLPFNIASYGLLLEILAKTVNMVPDELIGTLGDTHLYLNHIEQAKEQIGRDYTYSERFNILKEKVGPMGLNHDRIEEEVLASTPARTREPFELPKLIHGKTDDFYKSLSDSLSLFGHLDPKDFKIEGYQSHPTIKASLSN